VRNMAKQRLENARAAAKLILAELTEEQS